MRESNWSKHKIKVSACAWLDCFQRFRSITSENEAPREPSAGCRHRCRGLFKWPRPTVSPGCLFWNPGTQWRPTSASDKLLHNSCKVSLLLQVFCSPGRSAYRACDRISSLPSLSRLPCHSSRPSPSSVYLPVLHHGDGSRAALSSHVLASACFNSFALWQCFNVLCQEREKKIKWRKMRTRCWNAVSQPGVGEGWGVEGV